MLLRLSLGPLLALAACTPSAVEENAQLRDRAADATQASVVATTVLALVDDGRVLARDVADGASTTLPLLPLGCAAVDRARNQFAFTYDGCRAGGPGLDGTYTIVVAAGRGQLEVDATDIDLTYGALTARGSVRLSASVDRGAATSEVQLDANLEGALENGRSFAFDGTLIRTKQIGASCTKLEGSIDTRIADRAATVSIANWQRCSGACPEAGATLTVSSDGVSDMVVSWDGSARATVSVDGEARASIPLRCGAE